MIQCFAINLLRDTERLKNIKSQFAGHEDVAQLNIVEAIDGRTNEDVLSIFTTKQDNIIQNNIRMMSLGEIACFMSHQKALKKFLQTDENHALILEDDAVLTPSFWEQLPEILVFCKKNNDLVLNLLPVFPKGGKFIIESLTQNKIIQYTRFNMGAVCYIVTRNTAHILVNKNPYIIYDEALKRLYQNGVKYYTILKPLAHLYPVQSSIGSRVDHAENTKKRIGILKYRYIRIRNQIEHQVFRIVYNIKTYGLLRTVKAALKLEK